VTVTATDVVRSGFWTVWPGTSALPLASVLNTSPGDTVGNTTFVPVAADGTVSVFSQSGGQLVVDVVGWVTDSSAPASTAGRLAVLSQPVRIVDTRFGLGDDRPGADTSTAVTAKGAAGIPADAAGLLFNLTTVGPDSDGYVTVFPAGAAVPPTSTANPTPARDPAATAVMTGLGAGTLELYTKSSVDVVLDAWGWLTG
jgi:hypothetical protein